jgi:hypothetical protein
MRRLGIQLDVDQQTVEVSVFDQWREVKSIGADDRHQTDFPQSTVGRVDAMSEAQRSLLDVAKIAAGHRLKLHKEAQDGGTVHAGRPEHVQEWIEILLLLHLSGFEFFMEENRPSSALQRWATTNRSA